MKFWLTLLVLALLAGCQTRPVSNFDPSRLEGGAVFGFSLASPSRGLAPVQAYLPPDWDADKVGGYPLVIFLHGQSGSERSFFSLVDYGQLNRWIEEGQLPPFVLVAVAAKRSFWTQWQWTDDQNEPFLTSPADGELLAFARRHLNAGKRPGLVSLHGHSRGARGALQHAFKYPNAFASAIGQAFVSDYALDEMKSYVRQNLLSLKSGHPRLRMVIGTADHFITRRGREASSVLHSYLKEMDIPHEYEVLDGVSHWRRDLWPAPTADGSPTGLYGFQFHARAWRGK